MIGNADPGRSTLRARAHEVYRRSLVTGAPLSGAELGSMFGRSDRWARRVMAGVRDAGVPLSAEDVRDVLRVESHMPELLAALDGAGPTEPPVVRAGMAGGADEPPPRGAAAGSASSGRGRTRRPVGYWWALCAFLGGAALSVAANIADALYPTAVQVAALERAGLSAAAFVPPTGAVVTAACWPLLLLGAVEVLTRVEWPRGFWWGLARYGGAVAVALIAAVMSYRHMAGLLTAYGEDWFNAHLGPLAVDGLMVVSGFALLALGLRRQRRSDSGMAERESVH